MAELRFYFDESVELTVSHQLAAGGIDAVSAHSLMALGDADQNHLRRATELGRVLCTYDSDFLRLAASGVQHAGIIYSKQRKASIGSWIREIRTLHARLTAHDLTNRVVFLSGI